MRKSLEQITRQGTNLENEARDRTGYARLDISNETVTIEAHVSQSQGGDRMKPVIWWIKVSALLLVATLLVLIFLKWGVPFIFEKVLSLFLSPRVYIHTYVNDELLNRIM